MIRRRGEVRHRERRMARRERKHAWNKSNEIIIMMPMFVMDLKSRPNTIINMVELCPIGKEKSIQSSIPYIIPDFT